MSNKRNKKHFVITTGTLLLSMALLGCSKENIKPAFNEIESVQYESETALADTEKAENYEKKIEVISEKERELVEAEMDQAELMTDIDVETGELIVVSDTAETEDTNVKEMSYDEFFDIERKQLEKEILDDFRRGYGTDYDYETIEMMVNDEYMFTTLSEQDRADFLKSLKAAEQKPAEKPVERPVEQRVVENDIPKSSGTKGFRDMTPEERDAAMRRRAEQAGVSVITSEDVKNSISIPLTEDELNTTFY